MYEAKQSKEKVSRTIEKRFPRTKHGHLVWLKRFNCIRILKLSVL